MNTAVFNINDIPLLLVIFECLMLSILVVVINHGKTISNVFLALFLLALGLDALDTLIYWNAYIKPAFLQNVVHIFFILKFSIYLKAPMLFLYTKSIVYSDYSFTRRDAIHLLPLALSPLYLTLLYQSLGEEHVYQASREYGVLFNNVFFQGHLWARNIIYIVYSALSYRLLIAYKEQLKENYSSIDKIDHTWLRLLIIGFISIWLWDFTGYILDLFLEAIWLPDTMGIIGNYFNFIFINILVFYGLTYSNVFKGIASAEQGKKNSDSDVVEPRHIAALTKAMEEDKIYLEPEITLEELSNHVSLSIRQVSNVINRHFKQNFFEFINTYRVEQAKHLLQKDHSLSILDVMSHSGFNSKSAFNRYFKKFVDMTPTEFREAYSRREI